MALDRFTNIDEILLEQTQLLRLIASKLSKAPPESGAMPMVQGQRLEAYDPQIYSFTTLYPFVAAAIMPEATPFDAPIFAERTFTTSIVVHRIYASMLNFPVVGWNQCGWRVMRSSQIEIPRFHFSAVPPPPTNWLMGHNTDHLLVYEGGIIRPNDSLRFQAFKNVPFPADAALILMGYFSVVDM